VHSRARVRIDREAGILVALDHPNVVGILDRGRTADGSFFIAMDFVEGYSLDEYLDANCPAGPKDLAELIRLFVKICSAIGYAHEKGVLHRDLKPSNIRVDLRGEPHILDFGLARLVKGNDFDGMSQHSITSSGQLIGSLPWCSPEQAAGKQNDVSIRSDVYSLGLILYQAIAGEAPYVNRGRINEVVNNILNASPKSIAGIQFDRWGTLSEKLQSILFRSLEKVPEKRFASAGELAEELADVLLHPGPPTQVASKSRFGSRNLRTLIAAILILGTMLTVSRIGNRPQTDQKKTAPLENDKRVVELVNGRPIYEGDYGIRLVYCPPGRFEMGIKPNEVGYNRDEAAHWVTIEKGFYIATLELTQRQYTQVIPDRVLSELYPGPDLPMASARWIDADQFCRELSMKTKKRYRLPTEAEWEYACRAGSTGNFGGSDDLKDVGWYMENTPPNMMPKGGTRRPNAWKIYDMHGSVWEWCSDDFKSYFPATDDPGASSRPQKVFRGGDITTSWELCRSGSRKARQPDQVMHFRIGIRVVLETKDAK
jgi:formylglycine-generating enzyme required for sulfatase activity